MNLRQWSERNKITVIPHCHARIVSDNCGPNRVDLWRLDDYRVSGVMAGSIWLVRREPLTSREQTIRGHVRNFAVGLKESELRREMELSEERNDHFRRDCLEEYLIELLAESRD